MIRGPETIYPTEAEVALRKEFGLPEAPSYDTSGRPSVEAIDAHLKTTRGYESEWALHLTQEKQLFGSEKERVFMGHISIADQPVVVAQAVFVEAQVLRIE